MPNFEPFTVMLVLFAALIVGFIGYFVFSLRRPTVTRNARVTGKQKRGGDEHGQVHVRVRGWYTRRVRCIAGHVCFPRTQRRGRPGHRGTLFWGFRPKQRGSGSFEFANDAINSRGVVGRNQGSPLPRPEDQSHRPVPRVHRGRVDRGQGRGGATGSRVACMPNRTSSLDLPEARATCRRLSPHEGINNERGIPLRRRLERPSAADRRAFLDERCAGDLGLRNRVEQLLAADGRASGILEEGLGELPCSPLAVRPRAWLPTSRSPTGSGSSASLARAAWARSGWPTRPTRSSAQSRSR